MGVFRRPGPPGAAPSLAQEMALAADGSALQQLRAAAERDRLLLQQAQAEAARWRGEAEAAATELERVRVAGETRAGILRGEVAAAENRLKTALETVVARGACGRRPPSRPADLRLGWGQSARSATWSAR